MNYIQLGNNIKSVRKALHMTQEQLSEMIDTSTVFISQIENGNRKPSLETVYKISVALNVSIDELINNQGTKELIIDTTEINSLLQGRTAQEIQLVTSIAKTVLNRLNKNQLIDD